MLGELRPKSLYESCDNHDQLLAVIKQAQQKVSTEGLINQTEAEIYSPLITTDFLKQIACRILLIHGGEDAFFPLNTAESMSSKINNSQLAIIDNCGHMPSIEAAQTVNTLLRMHMS